MGANQSSGNRPGGASNGHHQAGEMKSCYYQVLGLNHQATDDEWGYPGSEKLPF